MRPRAQAALRRRRTGAASAAPGAVAGRIGKRVSACTSFSGFDPLRWPRPAAGRAAGQIRGVAVVAG